MISDEKRSGFAQSYTGTQEGQQHAALYDEGREQARAGYEGIVAAANQGEDVTARVLLKLLPHMDTPANRDKGAWIHVAPTVRKDVKKWFEGAKCVKPGDWPRVSQAMLQFVRRCTDDPSEPGDACTELDALTDVRGLQAAMLSPILNALRPDSFLIYNTKARLVMNHFAGTPHQASLTDYPATNETGRTLIETLAQETERPAVTCPSRTPVSRRSCYPQVCALRETWPASGSRRAAAMPTNVADMSSREGRRATLAPVPPIACKRLPRGRALWA